MTKDDVIDLIKDAGYGVLATADGHHPKVRPMMPYLAENGNFLIATFIGKRLVKQIKANPLVELCFIDRKMNFARISGKALQNNDYSKKQLVWDNVLMLRQYFSSLDDPNFIIIEVETDKVEVMTPQQQIPTVLSLK
jgi:general stress protein 26